MKLRRFNADGISEFRAFLSRVREGADESPEGLLEHRTLTEIVTPETQIVCEQFVTKGDAARYLQGVLRNLEQGVAEGDAGLWTWLTALFFDSVCPLRDSQRVVRNDYQYIFEPRNTRHFYRHLLFVAWRILEYAPTHNRLFLRSAVSTGDEVTRVVMERLFLTRIPCIYEVLDRLYWDESRRRPRRGITGSKVQAGNLKHRLPTRIRQLEKTYDLQILDADQLLELLGDEFAFARANQPLLFEASE